MRISKRDTHILSIQAYAFQINYTYTTHTTDKKMCRKFFLCLDICTSVLLCCTVRSFVNSSRQHPQRYWIHVEKKTPAMEIWSQNVTQWRNRVDSISGEIHGLEISLIYFSFTQNNIRSSNIFFGSRSFIIFIIRVLLIVYLYVSTHSDAADA